MAIIALLLSLLLAGGDQLLKLLVVQYIKPIGSKTVINGLFNLEYVENRGAAFSMLIGQRWLFVAITLLVCILIVIEMFRYNNHEFFSWAASILIVAGGIGNMIDRVMHEYVIDYIKISFFPAVFNFGDCCVTVGAICFIIHILFFTEKSDSEKVMRLK
ncbi:MAG TPA: signal peptidase II [Caproicibacter sp.]|nr:signal peptidase II [Caproicibacter sp.]